MEDRKKILFVLDAMSIGGVSRALISVLHFLDYRRYAVDLLLMYDVPELADRIPPEVRTMILSKAPSVRRSPEYWLYDAQVHLFQLLGQTDRREQALERLRAFSARRRLRWALTERYDTVIAYKHGEAEALVAGHVDCPRKILFYHHGGLLDERLHEKTFPAFQRIIAVSDGVRELLCERYPAYRDRIGVIPNFADAEEVRRLAEDGAVTTPAGRRVICSSGRLEPEKRFDRAVEAAAGLKAEIGASFVWYLIGEGTLRPQLERQIGSLGLQDEVILTGALANPMPYVAASDVYVQTSETESYGLAMQEALILGKPVVSTATVGGKLLIRDGENGFLTAPDAAGICAAVRRALTEPLAQTDENVWKRQDEQTVRLWEELLDPRKEERG